MLSEVYLQSMRYRGETGYRPSTVVVNIWHVLGLEPAAGATYGWITDRRVGALRPIDQRSGRQQRIIKKKHQLLQAKQHKVYHNNYRQVPAYQRSVVPR